MQPKAVKTQGAYDAIFKKVVLKRAMISHCCREKENHLFSMSLVEMMW